MAVENTGRALMICVAGKPPVLQVVHGFKMMSALLD